MQPPNELMQLPNCLGYELMQHHTIYRRSQRLHQFKLYGISKMSDHFRFPVEYELMQPSNGLMQPPNELMQPPSGLM